MNVRAVLAAGIPVLIVSVLLTAVGIRERLERGAARTQAELGALAVRHHRGPKTCLRWLDAREIPPAETASVARRLVADDLDHGLAEVLAVTWQWTEEAEVKAHAASAAEEYGAAVLAELSVIDRAWLRTVGRNRLAELGPAPPDPELGALAERAAKRLSGAALARAREIWSQSPRPLVRPAETHLVAQVAAARARRNGEAAR